MEGIGQLEPAPAVRGQGDTMEIEMNISWGLGAKQEVSIDLASVRLPLEGLEAQIFVIVLLGAGALHHAQHQISGQSVDDHGVQHSAGIGKLEGKKEPQTLVMFRSAYPAQIVSYNGSMVQDSVYDVSGFFIPAHVSVSDVVLRNAYKQDTSGQQGPQTAKVGAELSNAGTAGSVLRIVAARPPQWTEPVIKMPPCQCQLAGSNRNVFTRETDEFEDIFYFVPTSKSPASPSDGGVSPGRHCDKLGDSGCRGWDGRGKVGTWFQEGALLSLRLPTGLQPARLASYLIEVEVLAPTPSQCLCFAAGLCQQPDCTSGLGSTPRLCQTNWSMEADLYAGFGGRIQVLDTDGAVVGSNDALLVGFALVSEARLAFSRVDSQDLAKVLMVTAPFGYEFPPGLYRSSNLQLRVTTPRTTPPDNRWYIQGRLRQGNTEGAASYLPKQLFFDLVCWGVADGLPSQQMDVSVEFAALQTCSSQLHKNFEAARKIEKLEPGYMAALVRFSCVSSDPGYSTAIQLHTVFLLRVTTEVEEIRRMKNGALDLGPSVQLACLSVVLWPPSILHIEVVIPPPGYLLSCTGLKLFYAPGMVCWVRPKVHCLASKRAGDNTSRGLTMRVHTQASRDAPAIAKAGREPSCIQIVFAATPMLAGSPYAFGIQGGTAAASAADRAADVFALQVLNPSGTVAESSFSVQAPPLQSFGSMEQPYLLWYDLPTPGTKVWVSLGLRVPRRAPAGLETLRISLPDGYEHTALARNRDEIDERSVTLAWRPLQLPSSPAGIFSDYEAWTRAEEIALAAEAAPPAPEAPTQVAAPPGDPNASTNTTTAATTSSTTTTTEIDALPVLQGRNWVNLGQRSEVQLRLLTQRPFPACELLLRFPVQLPSRAPRLNVWYVTLAFAANTSGHFDADVAFVVPGFDFFQQPPAAEHAQHIFDYAGYDYYQFSTQNVGAASIRRIAPLAMFLALAWALLP
ncbi:unnamed protein product [Symbiodinium natans]|uniref:Uncharacterized protein n=1 Tax=Symbiodinium natans TaxID=878477 RepID=A0A812US52_9DINO|nr:unnamed protein product [Symbiodinium natans]